MKNSLLSRDRNMLAGVAAVVALAATCGGPSSFAGRFIRNDPPCTTATAACRDRLSLQSGYLPYYRSFALDQVHPDVTRAVIIIHGSEGTYGSYFTTAIAAAKDVGATNTTAIIAPHFLQKGSGCKSDTPKSDEFYWTCNGWKDGDDSSKTFSNPVSSFEFIDKFTQLLDDKTRFPSLQLIVVTGHSGGAQFVTHYAPTNTVDGTTTTPITYVSANATSFLYLDNRRLDKGGTCSADGGCDVDFTPFYDASSCSSYNTYRYGLTSLNRYTKQTGADGIITNMTSRPITFLVGSQDVAPPADRTCGANAQGQTRLERNINYWNYLQLIWGASNTTLKVIDGCPHDASCMFRSADGEYFVFQAGQ